MIKTWTNENQNWYQGIIGDTCWFGAEKILMSSGNSYYSYISYISFVLKDGKVITKKYEYMTIDKLIEIAEKYLLLI